MVKRKKRLKKGIESLEKQIEIHKEKMECSKEEGNLELECYYKREIEFKKKDKEKREDLLRKQ